MLAITSGCADGGTPAQWPPATQLLSASGHDLEFNAFGIGQGHPLKAGLIELRDAAGHVAVAKGPSTLGDVWPVSDPVHVGGAVS